MQNISLGLGNRGHRLSISQGVGSGSAKGHCVEVALLDGTDQFVNTGRWWWVDDIEEWWWAAPSEQVDDEIFDDVLAYVKASDLDGVILAAKEWIIKNV